MCERSRWLTIRTRALRWREASRAQRFEPTKRSFANLQPTRQEDNKQTDNVTPIAMSTMSAIEWMCTAFADLITSGFVATVAGIERFEKVLECRDGSMTDASLGTRIANAICEYCSGSAARADHEATDDGVLLPHADDAGTCCSDCAATDETCDSTVTESDGNTITEGEDDDDDHDDDHDEEEEEEVHENEDQTQEEDETPVDHPRLQAYLYQRRNNSYAHKLKFHVFVKMADLFASRDERWSVCAVLSALHGYTEILSFDSAMIPMVRAIFLQCNQSEQRAFEHLVANPQLYAHLYTEEWCWKQGCVGCNLPRNKFDYFGDELLKKSII